MDFRSLDLEAPIFTQREAAMMTRADNYTLDNWVRHGHVLPTLVAGRRLFSATNLIMIDLMVMMQDPFKIRPEVARVIGQSAIDDYQQYAARDIADIANGGEWSALNDHRGDTTWELTRAEDGQLRATERGDDQSQGVMIVLPARLVARSVLQKVKVWMESEGE